MSHPAEDRLRDVDRAGGDWSWQTDASHRLTRLCGRFTSATGQSPLAHLGRPLFGRTPRAMKRREAFDDVPLPLGGRGGSYDLAGAPLFNDAGDFRGYRGIAIRRVAKPANETDFAFLGSVSNEFRTPLNAIIGFAEAMDGEVYGPLSERYGVYARDIAHAGRHLLSLFDDIFGASAIESGEAELDLSRIALVPQLDKAISIVSLKAGAGGISLSRPPVPEGLAVIADERRVCQILVNLLGNAIKFTPPGGHVALTVEPLDDARIAIEVSDDGPGIAPADQQRIFDKFERLQPDPYVRREGAGLGLAIARELALQMDGTLGVDSVPGEGARFTLTLPAA